jgi:plastocyanin
MPKPVYLVILILVLGTSIALCGCTGSVPTISATPTTTPIQLTAGPTVTIQNFAFSPDSITVTKGTTVTWVNQDTINHQIINDAQGTVAQGALFTSGSLQKGAGYSFRFDNPGIYPYHCGIHPNMKAKVIVT